MKLTFSSADEAFREEVRSFLQRTLPAALAEQEAQGFHLKRADYREWHQTLHRQGWAAPGWPVECGGTGWTPVQRHIWDIEYGLANAPEISVIGIGLVGPLICAFGDERQKQHYLPNILNGSFYFCQGFSETSAGSDLAQVRTRAVREADDYIVNGHKVWTSHAPDADFMICLCRTDTTVKAQKGLSMLIIPMDAPGVTVRPIDTIDGGYSVSEVFLDDVRVPASERLGEENMAWSYAKFLLNNERTHNAYIGFLKRYLQRLRGALGTPLDASSQAALSERLSRLEIEIGALEWSVLRVLSSPTARDSGAGASALKVTASDLLLRTSELELDMLGNECLPRFNSDTTRPLPAGASPQAPGKVPQYLYWRASSIFGGANDIQKSIIWNTLFR